MFVLPVPGIIGSPFGFVCSPVCSRAAPCFPRLTAARAPPAHPLAPCWLRVPMRSHAYNHLPLPACASCPRPRPRFLPPLGSPAVPTAAALAFLRPTGAAGRLFPPFPLLLGLLSRYLTSPASPAAAAYATVWPLYRAMNFPSLHFTIFFSA
ncbi:hypothetical protein C8R43DRAFT_1117918 [Mycena crocata]|nr:hypothetical protein C8R43DRAFT_1117918 [Mycena crocata]